MRWRMMSLSVQPGFTTSGDRRYISYANFLDATAPSSQAPFKPYAALQNQDFNGWGIMYDLTIELADNLELFNVGSWREYTTLFGQDTTFAFGYRALSPLDLEREFGLVGGDIFHGVLALDQLWSARPLLGHADYRGPVDGLYLCGQSTISHGVAGVTASGIGAAKAVLNCRSSDILTQKGSSPLFLQAEKPESWPEQLKRKMDRGEKALDTEEKEI